MSRATVTRSFWPWSMRLNLARLVFSQSCSLFLSVVSLRLPIISLILSLSEATSPCASTLIRSEHAAELGQVGLQPVLLAILECRVLEVADHLVDIVLE